MKNAKVIKKIVVFDKFKRLVEEQLQVSDGNKLDWVYLDTPASVIIIALTKENKLIIEKLYRYNIKQSAYELPAGNFDLEKETPVEAAKRELLEETGYTSEKFVDLGKYYVLPSETNRWVHYFLALDTFKIEEPQLDSIIEKYFDISLELVDFEKVTQKIGAKDSEIKGVESSFGILIAKRYLGKLNV